LERLIEQQLVFEEGTTYDVTCDASCETRTAAGGMRQHAGIAGVVAVQSETGHREDLSVLDVGAAVESRGIETGMLPVIA
jgi:hypothetical protein